MPLTRITSNVITDGTIVDADISALAGISPTKLGAGTLPVGTTVNPSQLNAGALPSGITTLAIGSTTARSLANRFAEVINVKDFGAIGDGVADDAPAIRSAFNYANTFTNSTIYFPNGNYNLGTFTDGTNTQPNSSTKECIKIQNFTSNLKYINIKGDSNTLITSSLWSTHRGVSGGSPNAAYTLWFWFEGNYGLNIENIEFKRIYGGAGQAPIRPSATDGFSSYGLNICIVHGSSVATGNEFCNIYNCIFKDFTKTIDVAYNKTGETQYCGSSIVKNNQFICKWGTASTSDDFVLPTIEAHLKTYAAEFSSNYCIGGPDDYSPISGTATGVFQYFRHKDGAVTTQGPKSIITNNFCKNYSIEVLFALPTTQFVNSPYYEYQSIINNNIIEDKLSPIQQLAVTNQKSFSLPIVQIGVNATCVGNTVRNAYAGITGQGFYENAIISNNIVELYSQTSPSYPFTYGIAFTMLSSGDINIVSITRSGSTATLTTAIPHNYRTGYKIGINGSSVSAYNTPIGYTFGKPWIGYTITVTGSNTFTFDVTGSPATSTGGVVFIPCIYHEISNNSIVCYNANNDTHPTLRTTGLNVGGSSRLIDGKIQGNTIKCYSKQNPALLNNAITTDTCHRIIDNRIEGWDISFSRGTGGDFGGTIKNTWSNKGLSNGTINSPAPAVESYEFYFKPTQIGWYGLSVHQVPPANAIVEFLVEGYSGWDSNPINPYPSFSQNLQYTKLEYVMSGGYNNAIGPNSIVCKQLHSDSGNPVITKVGALNLFPNDKTYLIFYVSSTGGAIKIKTQSTRNPEYQGSGGAPSDVQFVATTSGGITGFSDYMVFDLKNGNKTLQRGSDLAGFGGRIFGNGTPILGIVAPTTTPEYAGQMFIDYVASKFYIAKNTTSSTDWIAIN